MTPEELWKVLVSQNAAHKPSEHSKVKQLVMISEKDIKKAWAALENDCNPANV